MAKMRTTPSRRAIYLCNTVEPHPFVPDPDDEWKPDGERECLACSRYPRDWEHKINGRYRRAPDHIGPSSDTPENTPQGQP